MHFEDLLIAVWLHNEIKRLSWYKWLSLCSSSQSKPSLEVSRRNSSSRLPHQTITNPRWPPRESSSSNLSKTTNFSFPQLVSVICIFMLLYVTEKEIDWSKIMRKKKRKNILLPLSWESNLLIFYCISRRSFVLNVNLNFFLLSLHFLLINAQMYIFSLLGMTDYTIRLNLHLYQYFCRLENNS